MSICSIRTYRDPSHVWPLRFWCRACDSMIDNDSAVLEQMFEYGGNLRHTRRVSVYDETCSTRLTSSSPTDITTRFSLIFHNMVFRTRDRCW